MSRKYNDIDRKSIEQDIRKFFKLMTCIDISDEFDYDDMMAFDCMVESNKVVIAVYDGMATTMTNLKEYPMMENDIDNIVGGMMNALEEELYIKYDIDDVRIDYQLYTFYDYADSIKFVLLLDFSNKDRRHMLNMRKNIVNTRLMGNSKFLM